jgi:ABC-2 type transport system permease protein
VREFRLWQTVDVLTGAIVVGVALAQLNWSLSVLSALGFVTALVMGAALTYCFWLMITTTAFWFIRVNDIANLFEGLYAAGRWPVDIYPLWLRTGLTFLVPVAFAVTIPASALTGRLTIETWLGALGLTVFFLVISRLFWRRGLKNYSGASA